MYPLTRAAARTTAQSNGTRLVAKKLTSAISKPSIPHNLRSLIWAGVGLVAQSHAGNLYICSATPFFLGMNRVSGDLHALFEPGHFGPQRFVLRLQAARRPPALWTLARRQLP